MTGGLTEKRLQLLGGPGLWFHLWDRIQLGGGGDQGDVPVDESSGHGVVEGASDDQMHLQDGLRCKCPPTVGEMQHLFVEDLQVVGS